MADLRRWLPFLQWPRPTGALWRGEGIAALTLAVVMVPQSVAYASLAGMPPVTGLYATFLPALVAVLFSRSTRLSVGPTAITALLVSASLAGMAQPGSAQWVMLAVWLALLAGLMQLVVGACRAAWLLSLVSAPVMAGFTQAAALLIIGSQLPALLGVQGPLLSLAPTMQGEAAAYGVGSLALLWLARRYAPRFPMALVVVLVAGSFSAWSGFGHRGAVVGDLPGGLPALYLPPLPGWDMLTALIVPAMVVALVSSLEMAASARIESQQEGRRWDADQDLIGQGVGKLTSAFSGAFATSTSFSRSALTLYAGARTGWATVLATGAVLVVLLFLTPALAHVPQAALAAVVIAAVLGLVKPASLLALRRIDRVEAVTAGVTFAVTLLASPRIYWGVLTGVVMGLVHFLYLRLHPRIIETGLHPDGSLRDRHLWQLPPLAPDTYALRMDSALDFAAAGAFERTIAEQVAARPGLRRVCLFAQPINRIDATGVDAFAQVCKLLAAHGIELHISGIKLPVEQVLRRAGALPEGPLLRLYRTEAEALEALQQAAAPRGP